MATQFSCHRCRWSFANQQLGKRLCHNLKSPHCLYPIKIENTWTDCTAELWAKRTKEYGLGPNGEKYYPPYDLPCGCINCTGMMSQDRDEKGEPCDKYYICIARDSPKYKQRVEFTTPKCSAYFGFRGVLANEK
jgi:hypothetical protein